MQVENTQNRMIITPVRNTISASDQFDIFRQGMEFSYSVEAAGQQAAGSDSIEIEINSDDPVKIRLIENFLLKMTGHEVNLRVPIKIVVSGSGLDARDNKTSTDLPDSLSDPPHQLDRLI